MLEVTIVPTDTDQERLAMAMDIAQRAHAGQIDKGGRPYIYHPMRVGYSLLPDADAAIVGLLHDTVEDSSKISFAEISKTFGREITFAVALLTRGPEGYDSYVISLLCQPLARRVKLADLADNLRIDRLQEAHNNGYDVARLVRKYVRATAILLECEELLADFPHFDAKTD